MRQRTPLLLCSNLKVQTLSLFLPHSLTMSLLIAGLRKLIVLLSLMPLQFSFCTASKHNNNLLVPGQSISAKQTLISSSGNFALGFFRPAKSTKYFLGIWYNAMPNPPIVWVANREAPLNSPGVLKLRSDGNLVVLENEAIIWSSNASVPASAMNSTVGLLMDSGNFVLRLGEELDKNPLWQSFDHPSDTLLPGMKISLNKRTGQQRRLTSWSAVDDPKPGISLPAFIPKCLPRLLSGRRTLMIIPTGELLSTI